MPEDNALLKDKVALITGASQGLGRALTSCSRERGGGSW